MNNQKVAVISLGCDKNRVDSENLLYILDNNGYTISSDEDDFDIVIINTCAFIESAQREAIDNIFDMVEIKKTRPIKIIVSGCMSIRYAEDMLNDIPEIDAVIGFRDYQAIVDVINRVNNGERFIYIEGKDKPITGRIITTPYHYAYLKIAEGCDNKCTYCAIPKIRGKYISREIPSLIAESKKLVDNGVKELILVAQDVSRYGIDIYNEYSLLKLVEELSKLDVEWIRLLYLYPETVSENLIKELSQNPKLTRYMDIPLQHISGGILKKMNRRVDTKDIKKLIETIRKYDEDIAIRSTFITGFPTETDAEHKELVRFIEEYKLDYAGFFAYSQEKGTPAYRLSGQIEDRVKQERLAELENTQYNIMLQNAKNMVGNTIKVLYDGADYDRQEFVARSEFNAPEIDANVLLRADKVLEIGEFYDAKIIDTDGIDLIGKIED